MVDQKTFDPYDMFKKFSDQWEKQANDFIKGSSNDPEFVSYSRLTSDTQARYLEFFKKNQEFFANQWNVPTKADLSNVAKLAIQTEEKLDSLEEQLWKLQDSVDSSNKEMESITEVSRDIIKLVKQLKKEQTISKKELEEVKQLKSNLQEVKSELAEIHSLKEEILILKELMGKNIDTKAKQEQNLAVTSK
ncbi:polyhydroxyalkanoate biosynthesis repressor PhaR [Peribacillus sp. FSL K6-1552]|uniref:polyhydroxyalkanoate biosynthesis repressor PhaR n=1 Tax=Peribacillus TaxID=2675229 RepID=UPI0030F4CDBE